MNPDWKPVATALLGRWPSQVALWGREALAAYIDELRADQLTPEEALAALRTYRPVDGKDFPPSVAVVVDLARQDPSKPTFDEMLTLVRAALKAYNLPLIGNYSTEAQMLRGREQKVYEHAAGMHPLVAHFIDRHGVSRLQDEIADLDGDYGAIRRRELEQAWQEHCDALEGREIAALHGGRRGGDLAQLDPLAALNLKPRRELAAATTGGNE